MVTEFGGIAFSTLGDQGEMGGMETWGYHDKVKDEEAFYARFKGLTDGHPRHPLLLRVLLHPTDRRHAGDNGLLTPDRKPKVDPGAHRRVNVNPDAQSS
jgi:hypothetical protein